MSFHIGSRGEFMVVIRSMLVLALIALAGCSKKVDAS